MMRSLYSGVAGLKTHQTRMDVIGNNIANVNTTAYKSQSMTFSDLMYQTTQAASGANPTSGVGGVNARQIGLGAKTSAIKTAITGQGASQTTNDPFDLMITGENFFVVSNGSENFFTRDGSFYVDGAGNLCMTSTGYNVMGWGTDSTGVKIKQDIVQPLRIMSAEYMTYPPEATSMAELAGIVDSYDANVLAPEGKTVTFDFYDNLGFKYTVKTAMRYEDVGEFSLEVTDVSDANGNPVGDATAWKGLFDKDKNHFFFDLSDGKLTGIGARDNGTLNFTLAVSGLGDAFTTDIDVDASALVNFNNNKVSTTTFTRGSKDSVGAGRMIGEMSGVSIQKDGMIYATYDNGQSRLLGQIATASFANASGLAKEGDNLYSATQNSGDFDGIGVDITSGGGYMNSGVLEMSNVDLSAEFTEMITTQRGFQANSRIITVSDTLLEELTNLKR